MVNGGAVNDLEQVILGEELEDRLVVYLVVARNKEQLPQKGFHFASIIESIVKFPSVADEPEKGFPLIQWSYPAPLSLRSNSLRLTSVAGSPALSALIPFTADAYTS